MNSTPRKTWMTLRRTAPLAGLLAAMLCSAAAAAEEAPPATQPAPQGLVSEGLDASGGLKMTVNKSIVLHTRAFLRRVNVSQPDVADVNLIGPSQILITAKKAGATQIIIWDEADHSQVIDVVVNVDLNLLHEQLQKAFPEASIEATSANNAVVLRGRAPSIQVAQQIAQLAAPFSPQVVNLMEVSGGQQVVLKVRFAEVSRSVTTNLGFNAFASDGVFSGGINGLGPSGTTTGLLTSGSGIAGNNQLFGGGRIGDTAFEFFINALRSNNLLRTLAEPNLITMSGQQASFLAGGEIPIPVPQAGGGAPVITIEYKEFGVRLNFLPVVMGDGRIRLKVNPEVSQPDYSHAVTTQGFVIPGLTERKLQTSIELNEGQTLALAGLLQTNLNASKAVTPLLGDIPVLGALFRSMQYQRSETELVVLVTPYLVGALDPDQVPETPGEHWRYPTERELFLHQDLGGPVYRAPVKHAGPPAVFQGQHGFAPAASSAQPEPATSRPAVAATGPSSRR